MADAAPARATLDEWLHHDALPFALDAPAALDSAVDAMVAALGPAVELLGFGEALHGGEELLLLRNRLFERLVVAHGYRAITIESSYVQAPLVNEYIAGRGPASYAQVAEAGFGHGFGRLDTNRELVEWMRRYNADPAHPVDLHFYGFDMPSSPVGITGPRQVLARALEHLGAADPARAEAHRRRVEPLLGEDAAWEDPAIYADHTKSPGRSPQAAALRAAVEDLVAELRRRRPELGAGAAAASYAEALHHAALARGLLSYNAALADGAGFGELLGIRDLIMADNLAHIVARERGRGGVLAFAHNAHLQRGELSSWPEWQRALGAGAFAWWPAGAHIDRLLGPRYAVVGSAIGLSEPNGIAAPEAGALEAMLLALPGQGHLIPTRRGQGLPGAEIAALPARSAGTRNLSYRPLGPRSFTDFDWLAFVGAATYSRGAPPLPVAKR